MTDVRDQVASDGRGVVTAIVPAYERPEYTLEAIRSALAQTYPHVVVLVGDDSRTDAVRDAIATIDDPRVRYHRNTPALGAMGNWVDLARRADSEFIASLNDDDAWEPDFLARTVPPMLADPTIGMAFCDMTYVDQRGAPLEELTRTWAHLSRRDSFAAGVIDEDEEQLFRIIAVWNSPQPAFAAVLRRSMVSAIAYPAETDPCHDLWCTYRLWTSGARFHFTPARLTRYRVHDGNLTHAGFGPAEDFIWGTMLTEQAGNPAAPELRRRWARTRFVRAMAMQPGQETGARTELASALAGLGGWRRVVASAAARSDRACRAMWWLRARLAGTRRTITSILRRDP